PTQSSPYASYVTNIVLANNVDKQNNPVGPSTQFYVNQGIFVVMRVRNPPVGTHVIEAVWFINGTPMTPEPPDSVGKTVSGSANVYFMLVSRVAGAGQIRILWDAPPGDDGSAAYDPHLVATINFTVIAVAPGTTTPTPGPTPPGPFGPTPTPVPTMTPAFTPTPSA
ncbi:MAG TPA: hypothetical protein VJO13_19530, partial [Ktedonobacterales bacterium]|nr:hypothetical protein [Ktedonobacterales bacterium]